MPTVRTKGGLLARVNFPLYTVQMLTSRHILVGGGGGSSKTGVANGFEIFELSHNGVQFIAEEVTRHETGPSVVMNCTTHSDDKRIWIAAGQESHCQLYHVHPKVSIVENGTTKNDNLRHRNNKRVEEIKDDISNVECKKLQLVVKPADSIQTDFAQEEPTQRIVRISLNGKYMATGGIDGRVRIWKFPHLQKLHDIEAHVKEIDDMDFSPDNNSLASVAKDGKAYIWNVKNGAKVKELGWSPPEDTKYMYKRCRFKKIGEDKSTTKLFMLSNSTIGKNQSYLQLWDTEFVGIVKSVGYKETLSALAVSDDGKFVAVGTMFSGSVDIYIGFSLKRVLHVPGAHNMFVTGLEFLTTKSDGPAITSNAETAVVSISVDNRICIHSVPFRHTLPFWFVIMLIIFSVCGAFIFCSYLGI